MKKILIGILTFIYMAVSTGIAMEIHYCMGKQAGVEFFGSSDDKCGKCGMKGKNNGCCHDAHKFVKLEDSHKNVTNTIDFSLATADAPVNYTSFHELHYSSIAHQTLNNHSPPDIPSPSLCVLNCVFRI